MSAIPEIGQLVHVRQRRYLVEDVTPPPKTGDDTLVRLSGVDDDAQGQPLQVLWEHELDSEVLSGEAWHTLGQCGFDPAHRFSAYLHTLRWNGLTATDPNRFQAPFRAGIRLEAYQLEPLRKALQLPRVNLFIADDVGLGKTIEAGLMTRELLLRKKVREIVVACPPSMLLQWQDELETRFFGLTFRILDKNYLTQTRQARGFGVNPWTTHNRFLISQRLLIDETYTAPLRDWLGEFCPGALLILDEAHHAAPASGARYAIDSKITRAIRDLAPRFEHRLFLSATPHNGHSNSFSALLELLDPQRFCRGVPVRKRQLDTVMVRRLKEDLRGAGVPGFCQREVKQLDINGLPDEAPELALSRLLNQYRELREQRLRTASKRQQAASGLLLVGLQQRLLSSIEAFARTLKVHRRTVQKQWNAAQIARAQAEAERLDLLAAPVGNDDEAASLSPDDLQSEEDAQTAAATVASAMPSDDAAAFAEELRVLERMAQIADIARHQPDARIQQLLAWVHRSMCPEGRWNSTRVILFTEYEDTLRYVRHQLDAALAQTDRAEERLAIYRGSTSAEEREAIQRAFNTAPDAHPVRILLATDAAREGLNLQAHCANLFHLDVPWNPGRMEQRNGRIDRKLQPQPVVYCHYFYYQQRPEDRILATLIRKTATIQRELGSLSPVVEGRLAELLRGGIRHTDLARLDSELNTADSTPPDRPTVTEELDVARDRQQALEAQINTLRTRLERSQKQINFQEEPFRAALSAALQMQHAPILEPVTATPGQFTVPAETLRKDPTWAATLDTLRVPRSREQKVWQWRKEAPLRPVLARFGASPTPDQLLSLKVCDPAMGSRAFLVETCKQLAEALVQAWRDHRCLPELPLDENELLHARRLIALHVLYGVDQNPRAVELAQLSLWLATLAHDHEFTFLDHALKCGDSLVGMNLEALKIPPGPPFPKGGDGSIPPFNKGGLGGISSQRDWVRSYLEQRIQDALHPRARIREAEALDEATLRGWLQAADAATAELRWSGDELVAAALQPGSKAARTKAEKAARVRIEQRLSQTPHPRLPPQGFNQPPIPAFPRQGGRSRKSLPPWRGRVRVGGVRAFHWELEFPEVFGRDNPGFDVIVGNPPFVGGQKITGALGTAYRDYLIERIADGKKGSADLCAYFFLRAGQLLRDGGMMALLATNTIAQGDTREVGLDQLAAHGFSIPRAVPSVPWPGEASLEVAQVWLHRGAWPGDFVLNEQPVAGITPSLTVPGQVAGNPYRLAANADQSFQGSILLGMGFVLTPEEAQALLGCNPRNKDCLFPYLNGEDLNSRWDQSPSRWVINFHDWPLNREADGVWKKADARQRKEWLRLGRVPADYPDPVAADYPELLVIVEEKVKPDRMKVTFSKSAREKWWLYERARPELYSIITEIGRVLVRARVSNINSISFVPEDIVCSEATVVFASSEYHFFAMLQGIFHTEWLNYHFSSMRTDVRYTPSDCFETFPFPLNLSGLDAIGERYYTHRQILMQTRREGLTKTYNRFHNAHDRAPDIQHLRDLHIEMDQAVAAAYNWQDLALDHGFHDTKQGVRFAVSEAVRRELLDRLLALNHQRHQEEVEAEREGKSVI